MAADSPLLQPVSIGDLALKNRIAMAPMTRARAGSQRIPPAISAEYYAQRSSVGLIITEATVISEQANGWVDSPGIYTDAMVAGWKQTTAAVHAQGTPIFLQMWHCGRASHSAFHGGKPAVAPSAIPIQGDYIHTPAGKQPYETPRALETAEIAGVVEEFRLAAIRAKEAGFDGLEVHGANGYLINTFLESATNTRTDRYGGSVENRYRILAEVLAAVTTVFPANRVGVRLSPNGVYNSMGSPDFRETFLYVAGQLSQLGLAYLHVMDGLGFGFHNLGQPVTLKEARSVYSGIIMGNCGYTQQTAEAAISAGDADMIAFGRPLISNPDLVERFKNDWPLADMPAVNIWYSPGEHGYTDFPRYSPA